MSKKMNQRDRILRHLHDYGTLTNVEAIAEYGIGHLASRISELRKEGHPIISEPMKGKNRYGEKTRWARYRMGARA